LHKGDEDVDDDDCDDDDDDNNNNNIIIIMNRSYEGQNLVLLFKEAIRNVGPLLEQN